MYPSLFIYSPIVEYFGGFQVLTTTNKAAVNILGMDFCVDLGFLET